MGSDSSDAPVVIPSPPKAEKTGIDAALEHLQGITRMLQIVGILVVMMASLSLATTVGGIIVTVVMRRGEGWTPGLITLLIAICVSAIGLSFLLLWERWKRQGMHLYEEISDEVEWRFQSLRPRNGTALVQVEQRVSSDISGSTSPNILTSENGTRKKGQTRPRLPLPNQDRPNLDVRLQLRVFLDASTLPFGSGDRSATVYLFWYLGCIFSCLGTIAMYFRDSTG